MALQALVLGAKHDDLTLDAMPIYSGISFTVARASSESKRRNKAKAQTVTLPLRQNNQQDRTWPVAYVADGSGVRRWSRYRNCSRSWGALSRRIRSVALGALVLRAPDRHLASIAIPVGRTAASTTTSSSTS